MTKEELYKIELESFRHKYCIGSCYIYIKCEYKNKIEDCPAFRKYREKLNNIRNQRFLIKGKDIL